MAPSTEPTPPNAEQPPRFVVSSPLGSPIGTPADNAAPETGEASPDEER